MNTLPCKIFFVYLFTYINKPMEEIKKRLVQKYDDKNLYTMFFYYYQMSVMEVFYFWSTIQNILNEYNVVIVLGFLLDLQDNPVVFPRYAQKSLNFHIHQVNKRISKLLPRQLMFYIRNLKLFKFAKDVKIEYSEKQEFNCHLYLIDLMYNLLIKTSTIEIANAVDKYYNNGLDVDIDINMSMRLLDTLYNIQEDSKQKYIKYISYTLHNPKDVMEFVYRNMERDECALLLEHIFIFNKDLYNEILQLVYDNVKYYKIEIIKLLPQIDLDKFGFRDENLEIIKHLLVNKPLCGDKIVEILLTKFSRRLILQVYSDHYDILQNYKTDITFEEMLEIISDKPHACSNAYALITSEEQKIMFCNYICKQDEHVVLDFLRNNHDDTVVSYLLSNKQLKGDLKEFVLQKYKNIPGFFNKLLPYLSKSECIAKLLEVESTEQLDSLLRVLKPVDVLVEAHCISDMKIGIKLIDLCFASREFGENDFANGLNAIQSSMPPLIFRTLILALKKFNMKNFGIGFLVRVINATVLQDDKLCTGVIKAMEIIGHDSINIIISIGDECIKAILEKSRSIKNICADYVHNPRNRNSKDYERIRYFATRR